MLLHERMSDAPDKLSRDEYMYLLRSNSDSDNEQGVFLDGQKFEPPKEANTVLSALSVLTAAIPDQEYIKNPAVRKDEVIHDKLYHPED